MSAPEPGILAAAAVGGAPERSLTVHLTEFVYRGQADPSDPGGIAAVYRDLAADEARNQQVLTDVLAALARGRNCLVLTQWTAHVSVLADLLRAVGHDPVVLQGGTGVGQRRGALERLRPNDAPLLVVATGPYIGEGFDCPALDTLFLAASIAFKGRLVQYVGRVLRPAPGKHVVEVHDYHDIRTGVLASSLRKRAPDYRSLGFPDPSTTRHHPPPAAIFGLSMVHHRPAPIDELRQQTIRVARISPVSGWRAVEVGFSDVRLGWCGGCAVRDR